MGSTVHTRERLAVSQGDCLDSASKNDVDVAFKNLVGNGASEVAQRWADQGNLMKKIELLRKNLDAEDNRVIDELCGLLPLSAGMDKGKGVDKSLRDANDSDCESYDSGVAHDGIANLFWVGSDDKEIYSLQTPSSPVMMEEEILAKKSENMSPARKSDSAIGKGAHRINRLTPESSPIRPRKPRPAKSNQIPPYILTTPPKHHPEHRVPPEQRRGDPDLGSSSKLPIILSSSPARPLPGAETGIHQLASKVKKMTRPSEMTVLPRAQALESALCKSQVRAPTHGQLQSSTNAQASSSKPREVRQFLIRPASTQPCVSSSPTKRVKRPASQVVSDYPRPQKKVKTRDNSPEISRSGTRGSASLSQLLRSPPSAKKQDAQMLCLDISAKLAKAYPNMVKPSYSEKKTKRLGLVGNRSQSDDIVTKLSTTHGAKMSASTYVNASSTGTSTRPKTLQPAKTLPCFDENEKSIDWNRSGLLAEALRHDIKHGRAPSLPSLECLGTDSQSPVTK